MLINSPRAMLPLAWTKGAALPTAAIWGCCAAANPAVARRAIPGNRIRCSVVSAFITNSSPGARLTNASGESVHS